MPKQVDHQQRRAHIARALWRVAAERGLTSVSVRHVAAEAGVSPGMVQHYFRTKAEMMRFARDALAEQGRVRLEAKGDILATASPGRAVREILIELLPLDDERHLEGQVAVALAAYAVVEPSLLDGQRDGAHQLIAFIADRLHAAQAAGTADAGLDVENEAAALYATVEGLNVLVQSGIHTPDAAEAVFSARLRALFGEAEL